MTVVIVALLLLALVLVEAWTHAALLESADDPDDLTNYSDLSRDYKLTNSL